MTGANRVFLDTNLLMYAVIPESPRYFHARGILQRLEQSDAEAWVSRQVLREFLAGMSRPQVFAGGFSASDMLTAMLEYERQLFVAEDHALVTEQLCLLIEKVPSGGKQIHDANIVATMLAFDIPQLITYNLDDFRRFSGLISVSSEL